MDVRCERCKTEYEFDDALVSGRGTTVRCNECGHQFKVRRADAAESPRDEWIVRGGDGRAVTFLTLRELQQAILSKHVRRSDVLERSGSTPRVLGSIPGLEPFFEGRTSSRPSTEAAAAAASGALEAPPPPSPSETAFFEPAPASAAAVTSAQFAPASPRGVEGALRASSIPPMRRKVDTLRPPLSASAAPPPPVGHIEPQPVVSPRVHASEGSRRSAPSGAIAAGQWANEAAYDLPGGPDARASATSLPPPTRPVRRAPTEDETDSFRQSAPLFDEPYSARRRGRVGGWVVALTLLLAVGVVGWAMAKPYLVAHETAPAAQLDPRAQAFLAQGESALVDGHIETAQEAFDKASALAERDPRVLLDEARLSAAKADVPWLKLRLLAPDDVDDIRTTKAQLDEIVVRARRQADDALAAAPQDPAAIRAKVDALRLSGDRDAARALVAKMGGPTGAAETDYVLAALDLAETSPLWATAIDRLRSAAAAEGNAGRARAALTYALAKSGDAASARAELVKLQALSRPYPLLPSLHAYVDRAAGPPVTEPAPGPLATARPSALRAAVSVAATDANPGAGDPRVAMQAAGTAIKRGDFARARALYQGIVDRNPNDSEAVAGLGDIARLQGDPVGAIAAYKRAIAINPSYLPALLGVADTEWARGDHAAAAKAYGDIVDRFPEGTYPPYAAQRAESGSGGGATANPGSVGGAASAASPPKPPLYNAPAAPAEGPRGSDGTGP
jgi:predicted Zn finger-like uncharacterized protein